MHRILASLRTRILLLLGLILSIIFFLASYRVFERRNSDLTHALERLRTHAEYITEKQGAVIGQVQQFMAVLNETREIVAFSHNENCHRTLEKFMRETPYVANIVIADLGGEVVCSALPLRDRLNLGDRPYFVQALATRSSVIGEATYGRATPKWILPFAQSFHDEAGHALGVLGVALDLSWINSEFGKIGAEADTRIGLIDDQGTVLARYPDPEGLIGKNVAALPFFKALKSTGGTGTMDALAYDGVQRIFAISRFAETTAGPIYLWVGVSKASVTAKADQQFATAAAIAVGLLILSFGAAWFGSERLLIRPISAIVDAARRQRNGDYQARTGLQYRNDEIGQLACTFDEMTTALADHTGALATALKQTEAANKAKSVFLSNMSHELRTPLNAVIGFSRLMAKSEHLDEKEKRNLEIINRSGNHLLTLINDVLELSKIEAGRVGLAESTTDVGNLVAEVVDMLRPRAEQAGLALKVEADELPLALRVDSVKLRQVLINLVTNAIKFTQQGEVVLTIKRRSVSPETTTIGFVVRDTGIGIAPEDQERIFDPFVQLTTHAASAGTGLGLTITRQYLHMLGSELTLESSKGGGSAFRFVLTLQIAETAAKPVRIPGPVTALVPEDRGRSILVVDDSEDSRRLIYQLLQPFGFAIMEAANGAEAIEVLATSVPDLIVMDWRMPGMDGLEATKAIRAMPVPRQPKIIMLTASAFEEERQAALDAGIDWFLRKPVSEDEIYAALEALLGVTFERHQKRTAEVSCPDNDAPALDAEAIRAIPAAQRRELRIAVEELNRAKLLTVLKEISGTNSELAHAIERMVDAFRYKELWELIMEVGDAAS